jgi:lysophospholipase L1-like esterase
MRHAELPVLCQVSQVSLETTGPKWAAIVIPSCERFFYRIDSGAWVVSTAFNMRNKVVAALLACWIPAGVLPAQTAHDSTRFEKEIAAFEAADRKNPPPPNGILFIGSSSIRLWKTLEQDFPGQPVINRGFGGSHIIDAVHFMDRVVVPYRPRLVVLYAGGNDINSGKTPEQVFKDYKQFVTTVHKSLPDTRIAFISIAPNPARWHQIEQVRETNRRVEQHARSDARLAYIDVFSAMLGTDGLPRPEIFVDDRLHMNEQGYKIWSKRVGPLLRENH